MLKNSPDRRRVPPPPEQPISQQRPNISKSIASVALQDHFSSILSLDSLQRASRISFHHSPAVPKKVLPLHAQLVKKSEKQAKLAAQKQERRRRQLPEVKVVELLGLDEEERVLVDDLYGNSSANPRKIKQTLAEKYGLIPTANSARKLSSDEWEKLKEASGDRGDQLICPICQDEFKAEDQVLLSCSHTFHRRCLESYERYVNRKACPLCRQGDYEKRLIVGNKKAYIQRSIVNIQKTWRMWLVRRVYLEFRQAVPPENPLLQAKYYAKKLSQVNDSLSRKMQEESDELNRFFQHLDQQVAVSKEIIDRTTAEIDRMAIQDMSLDQWQDAWEMAKKRTFEMDGDVQKAVCPICINEMKLQCRSDIAMEFQGEEDDEEEEYVMAKSSNEKKVILESSSKSREKKQSSKPKPRFSASTRVSALHHSSTAIPKKKCALDKQEAVAASSPMSPPPPSPPEQSKTTKKSSKKALVLLSCTHVFHSTCLAMFERLDINIFSHVCPCCRSEYKKIELDELLDE